MTENERDKNKKPVKQRSPWWRRAKNSKNNSKQPNDYTDELQKEVVRPLQGRFENKGVVLQKQHVKPPKGSKSPQNKANHSKTPPKSASATKKGNFAFIDSQNLNLGVQKAGWKIDWRKFREWLRVKYNVTHAYMFIGYMSENETLYEQMHDHGFLVVLKPTNEIMMVDKPEDQTKDDKEKVPIKGNIDADLVLYAMKELPNYHQAVIVSNDGDFFSLVEYLAGQNKLRRLITPSWRHSMLLKPFESVTENLDTHRRELAYVPRRK